jgi:CRISPR-associated protein Csx10
VHIYKEIEMHWQLEITLLSAANPGSGEGWAGTIDSDVVFDEFGLPYIPARRIKGILREMANEVVAALHSCGGTGTLPLAPSGVESLFGQPGQEAAAPLAIANACLNEYPRLRAWMQWAQLKAPHLAAPDRVISAFTHLRQQTAIAPDGVAQDNSLRLTRVLNPGHEFVSEIEIRDDHEKYETLLALAAQVTRYLGGKRNRGLGRIRCRLVAPDTQEDVAAKILKRVAVALAVAGSSDQLERKQ